MAVFADTYFLQAKQPHYDAEMLLWPVNVWQVYTNKPRGRELNLFEKTILQLFNLSSRRSIKNEDIANWLGLEIDMVSYIVISQLIPNGWLTEKGQVTKKGKMLLDEEVSDSLTTAYIFQCAITEKWLPRVCFNLNEIVSSHNSLKPTFKLSRASDFVSIPFVVMTRKTNPLAPSEHDLNSIASEFQEAVYIAKNTRDSEQWQEPPLKFDKLTLATQNTTRAYISVWGDTTTSFEWTLFDPFDISTSSTWMTGLFRQVCKVNNALSTFALKKLVPNNEEVNYEEACIKFAENARFKVQVKYPDAGKIEGLTDALFEMFESYERVSFEKTPHNGAKASLIVSCGQILEIICTQLLKSYALNDPYRLPKPGTKDGIAIIKQLIREATSMRFDMLKEATRVQPSRIFNAAQGKNSSLRAQLVAIFISMKTHQNHPLKFLLDDQLYFNNFYKLTFLRDDCAHKNPPMISIEQANHAISIIDTFLNKLFNGIKNNG